MINNSKLEMIVGVRNQLISKLITFITEAIGSSIEPIVKGMSKLFKQQVSCCSYSSGRIEPVSVNINPLSSGWAIRRICRIRPIQILVAAEFDIDVQTSLQLGHQLRQPVLKIGRVRPRLSKDSRHQIGKAIALGQLGQNAVDFSQRLAPDGQGLGREFFFANHLKLLHFGSGLLR